MSRKKLELEIHVRLVEDDERFNSLARYLTDRIKKEQARPRANEPQEAALTN